MYPCVEALLEEAARRSPIRIAVAQADDCKVMQMVAQAAGIAEFVLIGEKDAVAETCRQEGLNPAEYEILDAPTHARCAELAVELVRKGNCHVPMKGNLHTSTFIRAVLNKETGIRGGELLSEITVTDKPDGKGLQLITDCAMAIRPDLMEKKQLIENAVHLARLLGIKTPRVACIAALETVNPAMPETIDAAVLSKMAERGQIRNAIVDGPLALDNAVSMASAENKGIRSPVAGRADILLMSDINMGNALHKAITYFAKKKVAVVVMGAQVPVLMNSRSDHVEDKLLSIALAALLREGGAAAGV